jgi:hypothetical protein
MLEVCATLEVGNDDHVVGEVRPVEYWIGDDGIFLVIALVFDREACSVNFE